MAFIFDFDGTLIDSMPIWTTVGSAYLKNRGITPEDYIDEKFSAFSLPQVAEYYIENYDIQDEISLLMKDIYTFVKDELKNKALPKPGVLDFLEAHRNTKMCIATASEKSLVEMSLKKHNMSHYFSEIFTCSDIGADKNNPDIYETALKHLGSKKSESFVFEDALYAIKTAKKANFRVVGVFDECAIAKNAEIQELSDIYIENYNELKI